MERMEDRTTVSATQELRIDLDPTGMHCRDMQWVWAPWRAIPPVAIRDPSASWRAITRDHRASLIGFSTARFDASFDFSWTENTAASVPGNLGVIAMNASSKEMRLPATAVTE